MRKVVHLTSVHSPFDTRIFHKQCRTLKEANYDVVLIAPHTKDEIRDGISIKAVQKANGRFNRMMSISRQVYEKALSENGSVYHFHDPELIPIGLLLKFHNKRVIYDVHEHYPRMIMSKEWLPKIVRIPVAFVVNFIELISSLFFDSIVVVLPFIGKRFQKKKVVVIRNYLLKEDLEIRSSTNYHDRPMTIIYEGNITRQRGITEMVATIERVNRKITSKLILVGRFDSDAMKESTVEMVGWQYVDYKGWMEKNSIFDLIGASRVGLALLHPVPTHMNSLPTKLFEYMAIGIPVVISNIKMWKDIVTKYNCGIVVNPFDIQEITDAITWLLENPVEAERMGYNGRRAVEKEFIWDREAHKLLTAYEALNNY
jgi:glycosyltransferase involved in cell wall biosynthesis